MNKTLGVLICFLLAVPVLLYSQTARMIEELLNTQAVSNEQAAWLVLEASDTFVSGDLSLANGFSRASVSTPAQAFDYAAEQRWFKPGAVPDGKARLDDVSLLLMRSFDIHGGLFFSILGSPHHAYRELVYRNIIQRRADPGMAVSGEFLLFLVNRVLSYREVDQL